MAVNRGSHEGEEGKQRPSNLSLVIWAEEFGRLCVDCYLILFLFETGEFLESDSERDYRSFILSVSGVWVFEYKSGVKKHRLDFLE
ncbi:hypothetical protein SDJN03_08040, partial [Cucurbita argyrosperma subsp. sororia]